MSKKLKIYKSVMEQTHSMHSSHGIQHKINELAIDGWSFVSLSLTQEGHLSTIAVAVLEREELA